MITHTNVYDKKVRNSNSESYYLNGIIINKFTLSKKSLIILSKLKKHVKGQLRSNNPRFTRQHHCTNEKLFFGKGIKKDMALIEIDIKNAFPSIALDCGIINSEIFDRLNDLNVKTERLMCLGAISSVKTIEHVNLKTGEVKEIKKDAICKPFFFNILKRMEDINMKVAKLLDHFNINSYFCYMDAFFIDANEIDKMRLDSIDMSKLINDNCTTKNVKYREKELYTVKDIREVKKYAFQKEKTTQITLFNKKNDNKPYILSSFM